MRLGVHKVVVRVGLVVLTSSRSCLEVPTAGVEADSAGGMDDSPEAVHSLGATAGPSAADTAASTVR